MIRYPKIYPKKLQHRRRFIILKENQTKKALHKRRRIPWWLSVKANFFHMEDLWEEIQTSPLGAPNLITSFYLNPLMKNINRENSSVVLHQKKETSQETVERAEHKAKENSLRPVFIFSVVKARVVIIEPIIGCHRWQYKKNRKEPAKEHGTYDINWLPQKQQSRATKQKYQQKSLGLTRKCNNLQEKTCPEFPRHSAAIVYEKML